MASLDDGDTCVLTKFLYHLFFLKNHYFSPKNFNSTFITIKKTESSEQQFHSFSIYNLFPNWATVLCVCNFFVKSFFHEHLCSSSSNRNDDYFGHFSNSWLVNSGFVFFGLQKSAGLVAIWRVFFSCFFIKRSIVSDEQFLQVYAPFIIIINKKEFGVLSFQTTTLFLTDNSGIQRIIKNALGKRPKMLVSVCLAN